METREVKNETLGVDLVLPEINQGAIEDYEEHLFEKVKDIGGAQVSRYYGAVVRAACEVGWITQWNAQEVPELDPRLVKLLGSEIAEHLNDARTIPPN